MEVKIIPLRHITEEKLDKADPAHSPMNKSAIDNLMDSIRFVGLINPITVREIPNDPGRYVLIAGRKRIAAFRKLKRESIPASIVTDIDDPDDIKAMILAENIWRVNVKKASGIKAIQAYFTIYEKRKGQVADANRAEAARQRDEVRTTRATATSPVSPPAPVAPVLPAPVDPTVSPLAALFGPVEPEVPKAAPAPPSASQEPQEPIRAERPSMARDIAAAADIGERQAKRAIKLARVLTTEQLDALETADVSQSDMSLLADIEDTNHRSMVINLVLSGMDTKTAIRAVMEKIAPSPVGNDDSTLSDEEWLEKWCGEIRSRLEMKTYFDTSALLYRAIAKERTVFKQKKGKEILDLHKAKRGGLFATLCFRFCYTSHPRDWLVCGACDGTGKGPKQINGLHDICPKCLGDGFKVRTENF